eukprot:gene5429-10884_t
MNLFLSTCVVFSIFCYIQAYILNNNLNIWGAKRLNHRSQIVNAEIRILIQGTKNAYTTIRPYDVILYGIETNADGQSSRLGVLTTDSLIRPLCSFGEDDLYIDESESPLSVNMLKDQGKLLRVVSSDRRGTNCFIIEEYINDDVMIPIKSKEITQNTVVVSAPIADDITTTQKPYENIKELDNDILKIHHLLNEMIKQREEIKNKISSKSRTVISTDKAPAALGPYSQAIKANGFIFISGCIGINPSTNKLIDNTIEGQTIQALENMKAILEHSGSTLEQVCKTTIMVADISVYPIVNEIYSKYFPKDSNPPARSTFAVAALPASALVEIEAIALGL